LLEASIRAIADALSKLPCGFLREGHRDRGERRRGARWLKGGQVALGQHRRLATACPRAEGDARVGDAECSGLLGRESRSRRLFPRVLFHEVSASHICFAVRTWRIRQTVAKSQVRVQSFAAGS